LLLVIFLAPIAGNIYEHLSRPPVAIPDEQIAGQDLLAEKFVGPRYFQPNADRVKTAPFSDRYYIRVPVARAQVPGIVAERKLTPDLEAQIYAIIDKIAEPSPSRVFGENGVNTLRLNLALDAVH
jgi:K+-transporting ATPase c subunit